MSKRDEKTSRPSHTVYAVTRREGRDKGYWTSVGAAWPHADGRGFSLKLDYLPLNGAELVIRERSEQPDGATQN